MSKRKAKRERSGSKTTPDHPRDFAELAAGRTRNSFTPPLRVELMKRLRPLRTETCPFANLPEKRPGRWGQGLTATKMKECRWLKSALIGQFEFVEWTADLHLRHTRFIALRDDKTATDVQRETA